MNNGGYFSRVWFIFITIFSIQFSAYAYKEVKVNGLLRISQDAVLESLKFGGKSSINEAELSEEVQSLYKTGFFSDVSAEYENGILTLNLVEVPVISAIKFNGLKQFKRDDIMPELLTKERGFYSKASVISDAKKLETIYKTLGILEVTVEPMVEFSDGGKIILIFNIKEGKQKKIRKISLEGNKSFSDYTLKDDLFIKEDAFYRMFSGRTGYNISQTMTEIERLKNFYMRKGFAKAEISYKIITLNTPKETVDVNIFIEEGAKYTFGSGKIINNIPALKSFNDEKLVKSLIAFETGKIYNIDLVEKTKANIRAVLQKEGYLFSEVNVEYEFNDLQSITNVNFIINPTKRIYISQIKIFGNLKTNDNVIRREFILSEGDVYDIERIRRSLQRLRNLQFFKDVQLKEKQIADDRIELNIFVVEAGTLSVDGSFSYDFGSSFGVGANLNESNLMGTGLGGSLALEYGKYSKSGSVSVFEPYLFDREFSLLSQTGAAQDTNDILKTYESSTIYQSFRGSYGISEYLKHSITYSIRRDHNKQLDSKDYSANNPIKYEQDGTFVTSSLGHLLSYDKRDNGFMPNSGYLIQGGQVVAGLGVNIRYFQNSLAFEQYFPLFGIEESVLGIKLNAKIITGLGGESVRLKDRFVVGGNNGLRGFDFQGVGPQLEYTSNKGVKDPLVAYGATNAFLGTLEYRFPNFIPQEFGFSTFVFFDFGAVFGYEKLRYQGAIDGKVNILDSSALRTAVGVGMSWRSPLGIIGVSYAKALKYQDFDKTRAFFFTIGGMTF